jgi:hypothetical protein
MRREKILRNYSLDAAKKPDLQNLKEALKEAARKGCRKGRKPERLKKLP